MRSKPTVNATKTFQANLQPPQRRLPDSFGEVLLALFFIPPLMEYFFLSSGQNLAERILVYSIWLLPGIILCYYLGQRGTQVAVLGVSPFLFWYGRAYMAQPSDYNGVLTAYYAAILIVLFFVGLLAEKLKRQEETLQKAAATDPMSGLFNQQFFQRALEREMDRARRYKESLSLICMNLNEFKEYNEKWGITQGDRALVTVSVVLQDVLRTTDIIARPLGSHFAIILPHTDLPHAKLVCERISTALVHTPIPSSDGGTDPLSASFGVTLYDYQVSARQLVDEANRLLYYARFQEKN